MLHSIKLSAFLLQATIKDGHELQIAVKLNNYATDEYFYLDNVVVSGDRKETASTPEPGVAIALAGVTLLARRRSSKTQ
jgi:hypothetical protein